MFRRNAVRGAAIDAHRAFRLAGKALRHIEQTTPYINDHSPIDAIFIAFKSFIDMIKP